jgi:hypothetical protein
LSTDAGTPAPGDGRPAPEPAPRRGLRDHPLGKLLLLGLVLLAALFVARTCGSNNREISQDRAVQLAEEQASFEPCPQEQCVQVRYVPRGIPVHGFWGVVLADEIDADGRPLRTESFLVDVETGTVSRP